jgi:hypothetical protein
MKILIPNGSVLRLSANCFDASQGVKHSSIAVVCAELELNALDAP